MLQDNSSQKLKALKVSPSLAESLDQLGIHKEVGSEKGEQG
jgi:hypothetical protein